ncbi:hypothetical protein LCM23_22870 [Cytobacillus kochii]|uniref:hypothetical protein n=1 Tax=Cytobacillus TaxID=2675230 RepID=UPI001CD819DB|nr:hypothetical protein [Cytobacillus kochii]MCA1028882.1 hypothetical protein [Cytobacillus kochii]MDM5205637.1 hypothetical protein [Cytobacillus kochii]
MRSTAGTLSLGLIIIFISASFIFTKDRFFTTNGNSIEDKKPTLIGTYNIGLEYVRKLDKKAELLHMNSVDDKKPSGENGEKSLWQLLFVLPTKDQRIGLMIREGEVEEEPVILDGAETGYQIIKKEEINLNTDEAVSRAINDFSLNPGGEENFLFKGYHFKLIKDNNVLFLTVVGEKDGEQLEVHFDATEMKYTGRTEHKGGE